MACQKKPLTLICTPNNNFCLTTVICKNDKNMFQILLKLQHVNFY